MLTSLHEIRSCVTVIGVCETNLISGICKTNPMRSRNDPLTRCPVGHWRDTKRQKMPKQPGKPQQEPSPKPLIILL